MGCPLRTLSLLTCYCYFSPPRDIIASRAAHIAKCFTSISLKELSGYKKKDTFGGQHTSPGPSKGVSRLAPQATEKT